MASKAAMAAQRAQRAQREHKGLAGHAIKVASQKNPPVDRFYTCYANLFFLAVATLLPWNAFISSSGYFSARLQGTPFAVNFLNYFGIAYNVTNVASLSILTYTDAGRWPTRLKVFYPFIIVLCVFTIQTICVLIPPSHLKPTPFFIVTVFLVMVCGLCNAFIQGGLFGCASRLPVTYVQGLMAGQGMGGVLPASLVVITVASSPPAEGTPEYEDVKWSSFAFFLMSSITAFGACFAYLLLESTPIVDYYNALDFGTKSLLSHSSTDIDSEAMSRVEADDDEKIITTSTKLISRPPPLQRARSLRAYSDIRVIAWGVFINFLISLALFPSVTANIYSPQAHAHIDGDSVKFTANPSEGRFFGDLFVPIYCFLLFNIFDFAGRFAAGHWNDILQRKMLLPLSIARVAFIPLLMMCNVVEVGNSMIPVVFEHVAYPILFISLLAFTNGYLCSLQFMAAPTMVSEPLQSTAGAMMCFFSSGGLLAGCLMSFLLHYLLCSCNPILQ